MASEEKILNKEQAKSLVQNWKAAGHQLVFTNGCFDIIHLGHVDYLEKAKALGDKLIVGLNTDNSVNRFKGKDRPIQDQNSRARVMAALASVDLVVLFDEDNPLELIKALLPDVLVKGSDYLAENIVGAEVVKKHGGVVKTIAFVPGYSSSKIINKIKDTK
jgi:D-glycero-beta-D-manno-heptose 1-phosphate adenylyltransferase